MSSEIRRARWEERYGAADGVRERPASELLRRHLPELPRGRALEVACGDGRNTLLLARNGWSVDAVDLSHNALCRLRAVARAEALAVYPVQADLECFPLPRRRYDVVVNVRFLQRSLWAALRSALRPGGMIVFETFLTRQKELGHPTNPDFLLEPGELRSAFADLEILHYAEDLCDSELGPAHLARLLARRPCTPDQAS